MKRKIRVWIATYVLARAKKNFKHDIHSALKFNHCNAIIVTKGLVPIDWYKMRGIPVIRCKHCLTIILKGTDADGRRYLCRDCQSKI